MPFSPQGPIGKALLRRNIARWRRATEHVTEMDFAMLSAQQDAAKRLLRQVSNFKMEADRRLNAPRMGVGAFPTPTGTDWAWRPKPWAAQVPSGGVSPALAKTEFTDELVLFHDCKQSEISLRQVRNQREVDLSPFGIDLEVFHLGGTYLSLVVEIPHAACEGLRKNHLIRLTATIEKERPTPIYARLNVKNGPNTEQILMTLPDEKADTMAEFDLAYSGLNERRAERMWLDLMIETPAMNKISFRDLTLCRYPRAEM